MKIILFLLFCLVFIYGGKAQQLQSSGSINTRGLFFSEKESPFWLHSNQRGRIDETTNFAGWLNTSAKLSTGPNSLFEAGLGGLVQDGYSDDFQLDESYLSFENQWLSVVLGRKQKKMLYHGLCATNQNILWSLNARPLPGIQLRTIRPIFFSNNRGVGFRASLEEYFVDDDERHVRNPQIHHKSFHLVYRSSGNLELSAGLQHFVMWGGTHPELGDLPDGFSAYSNVFFGKEGDGPVEGHEVNALGNHLGSYEFYLKTKFRNYNLQLIYNHLFEDGSGRRLGNTPDGRYGIYIQDEEIDRWINAFMFELYHTKHQSRTTSGTDGADNYFNNHLYRSGWTYKNRILGVPFITLNENRSRVNNNMIVAHHIGLTGIAFKKIPYKFLTSYRKNFGAKSGGNIPKHNILSTYLELQLFKGMADVDLQLGGDFNSRSSPNFGIGFHLSREFF